MQKPQKTFADYVVVAISPILIMVLVGSLAFFLIQVFYRGDMVHGIRWVMFWFVLAIVLVTRVGIEQSKTHGKVYGVALASTMFIYLSHTHRAPLLGAVLLAITWWCAHKLTTDCTLISDEEDASGEGVLQSLWRRVEASVEAPKRSPWTAAELLAAADVEARRRRNSSRTPGRWVIYFSLAALPLFGFGQLFLPNDDPEARRAGFMFLVVYLTAALSLLVTTSFLGLRRYLRQRFVEMPGSVAVGWIRFGAILIGVVLALALVFPRPGARNSWKNLTYWIEHKKQPASDYAFPFNAPGEGEGTPADNPPENNQPGVETRKVPPRNTGRTSEPNPSNRSTEHGQAPPNQDGQSGQSGDSGGSGKASDRGQSQPRDERPAPPRGLRQPNIKSTADTDQQNERPSGASDDGKEGQGGAGNQPRGDGRGDSPQKSNENVRKPAPSTIQNQTTEPKPTPEETTPVSKTPRKPPYQLLRWLLIAALAALFVWWLIRYRQPIAQAIRAFIAAVREFFRKLFAFRWRKPAAPAGVDDIGSPAPVLSPFATYENPFITGKDRTWPPERLLIYTYQAVQAWAGEQGIEVEPQQTPREFCARMMERYPDFAPELERFAYFYSHAAFAKHLPDDFETEPLRRLWQYLGDSVMVVPAA